MTTDQDINDVFESSDADMPVYLTPAAALAALGAGKTYLLEINIGITLTRLVSVTF